MIEFSNHAIVADFKGKNRC